MPVEPNVVKSIFLAAIEKPAAERVAFLDERCGGDAELRNQVEKMLAEHGSSDSLVDESLSEHDTTHHPYPPPPREAGAEPRWSQVVPAAATEGPGTRIGPYKLLQQIGEGGMGTVWMAEQVEPVKRMVALKVIKLGMDSVQVMARFEAERQAIALMDHPNIAKCFDAGTIGSRQGDKETWRQGEEAKPHGSVSLSPGLPVSLSWGGRPYFVMELVKGVPVTKYCDEHQLSPRERLELFVPVCQAIQHAHQKGIIHRDIKPSNVLVASYDGKPVPKVIDFGVAKATGQKLTERTLYTGFGAIVGTLEYMSPEQAEFNALDIDTESDIYALGVLLYELLTGTTPLTWKRVQEATLVEALRMIREDDPPRPSTRLGQSQETLPTVAARRKMDPAKLAKLMRGDLDWLVMKALEKDRNRRYETANSMALDIQRYLRDEPILAGPPGTAYRIRKFIKRHKGPLVAAAVILLALVGGIVGTTLGLVEATRQRDAAKLAGDEESRQRNLAETQLARAVKAEKEARDKETEARQSEAEARSVLEFFQGHVLAAARPKGLGGGLGIKATIRAAVEQAEPQIAKEFRDKPLVEAAIRNTLGLTYHHLGESKRAIAQYQQALDLRQKHLAPTHSDTLNTANNLAMAYQDAGQLDKALPLYEETLKTRMSKLGPTHADTLVSMNNLADAYDASNRLDDALALYEKVLKQRQISPGPEHPDTLRSMNNLASMYLALKRTDDAVALFEKTLKLARTALGQNHPETLGTINNLAVAYGAAGRYQDAVPLYEQVLPQFKDKLGNDHPTTMNCMSNLAQAYRAVGRMDDALPLYEGTLRLRHAKLGPTHPQTLLSEKLFLVAADNARQRLGLEHATTMAYLNHLGDCYEELNQPEKAEAIWRELAAFWKETAGVNSLAYAAQLSSVGDNLLQQRKFANAEPILRECLAIREKQQPDGWPMFNTLSLLGGSLLGQKKYADAESLVLKGYDGMEKRSAKIPPQRRILLTRALERIVQVYEATGQTEKAESWRAKLKEQSKQNQ